LKQLASPPISLLGATLIPQVVNLLQPPTLKVVMALCVVRNSIGENSYVSDEVITAKSGARVRVSNTDAEGRLAMADALYYLKEMALCSINPHLFTLATMTEHAAVAAGSGYCVSVIRNCVNITYALTPQARANIGTRFEFAERSRVVT